jgi:hypothetical protein
MQKNLDGRLKALEQAAEGPNAKPRKVLFYRILRHDENGPITKEATLIRNGTGFFCHRQADESEEQFIARAKAEAPMPTGDRPLFLVADNF